MVGLPKVSGATTETTETPITGVNHQSQFEIAYREAKGAAEHGTEQKVLGLIKTMRDHGKLAGMSNDALDVSQKEIFQVFYNRAVKEAQSNAWRHGSGPTHLLFASEKYRSILARLGGIDSKSFEEDNATIHGSKVGGNLIRVEESAEQFVEAAKGRNLEKAATAANNALEWGGLYLSSAL